MDIEIKESKKNRVFRLTLISIAGFIIIFGIFFTVFQILMKNMLLSVIGILIIITGYWLKKRIYKIKKISKDAVSIVSGEKEITLHKDTFSIIKLIRFTISQSFLFVVFPNKSNFFTKFYLVFNEPEYDIFTKLKNMGVRVHNVPD